MLLGIVNTDLTLTEGVDENLKHKGESEMKIKTKHQILKDKVAMVKRWIIELNLELRNSERSRDDYEHEIHKKIWILKETVNELKQHEAWLATI